jgi:endonuclease/exonuclease/phosphatase family metal-dependent hydrolase
MAPILSRLAEDAGGALHPSPWRACGAPFAHRGIVGQQRTMCDRIERPWHKPAGHRPTQTTEEPSMRAFSSIRTAALGSLIAICGLLAARPAAAFVHPIRLVTYNTALMTLKADATLLVPPWQVPVTIATNRKAFGGQTYSRRIELMADYIEQEDPDVVVLNEVWDDVDKDKFIKELVQNGPYTSYIRKVSGPIPGFSNPFAAPGIQTDIELLGNFLGTGAGDALMFLIGNLVGVPGIVDLNLQYQDAGIMLFSKSPFAPFTKHLHRQKNVFVEGINGGVTWGWNDKEVAVNVYERARGMDQLASKAVAMVRIERAPGDFVNVAFSHTNADEVAPEENADVRAFQMAQVKRMIRNSLSVTEAKTQPVYLLGDLNTPGSNEKYGASGSEWATVYGANAPNSPFAINPGRFFACGHGPCTATAGSDFTSSGSFMTDAFGFETSMEDQGKTNWVDTTYYDYVLHNQLERQCMQHIRIGNEMQDDLSHGQLSDHLPVHVDFNLVAAQCTPDLSSPWGPRVVQLDYQNVDAVYASNDGAKIAHSGNMQWYYIPDKGTYWIQSFNDGVNVAFDVYEDKDLSNPIQPYHNEVDPEQGKRFVTTRPIFIRVYAVNPNGTPDRFNVGDYQIHFHRATGASPWDSIALKPTAEEQYTWGGFPQGLQKVWFDFTTSQTFGAGEFAENTIVNTSYWNGALADPKSAWINEVYELVGPNKHSLQSYVPVAGSPGVVSDYLDPTTKTAHGYQLDLPDLPGLQAGQLTFAPKKYWYAVSTDGTFNQPPTNMTTYLTFTTDLQYLTWVAIESIDHKYWDEERVRLDVMFDDFTPDACPDELVQGMCDEMWLYAPPSTDMLAPNPLHVGPFKRGATPSIWAHHPLQIGNWYHIGHDQNGSPVETINIAPGNPGTVNGCSPIAAQLGSCETMVLSDKDDYAYRLYYGVSHDAP